jgi:hypothetical protein
MVKTVNVNDRGGYVDSGGVPSITVCSSFGASPARHSFAA